MFQPSEPVGILERDTHRATWYKVYSNKKRWFHDLLIGYRGGTVYPEICLFICLVHRRVAAGSGFEDDSVF